MSLRMNFPLIENEIAEFRYIRSSCGTDAGINYLRNLLEQSVEEAHAYELRQFLVILLNQAHRHRAALFECENLLLQDPTCMFALRSMHIAYVFLGEDEHADHTWQQMKALSPDLLESSRTQPPQKVELHLLEQRIFHVFVSRTPEDVVKLLCCDYLDLSPTVTQTIKLMEKLNRVPASRASMERVMAKLETMVANGDDDASCILAFARNAVRPVGAPLLPAPADPAAHSSIETLYAHAARADLAVGSKHPGTFDILLDACVGFDTRILLGLLSERYAEPFGADHGLDIKSIRDWSINQGRAADEKVVRLATELDCVLITYDNDFASQLYDLREMRGIIVIPAPLRPDPRDHKDYDDILYYGQLLMALTYFVTEMSLNKADWAGKLVKFFRTGEIGAWEPAQDPERPAAMRSIGIAHYNLPSCLQDPPCP